MGDGRVRVSQNKRDKSSESPKAAVKLRYGEFAFPHQARATMGPAATVALLPGLLALVRVREEGQRSGGRISTTIDDGYGRVSRRRETMWDRGRADVRLVRFGRGQVSDEWGHAAYRVRRRDGRSRDGAGGGLSLSRFRKSAGMESYAVRSG
jgi:hypothetical protein